MSRSSSKLLNNFNQSQEISNKKHACSSFFKPNFLLCPRQYLKDEFQFIFTSGDTYIINFLWQGNNLLWVCVCKEVASRGLVGAGRRVFFLYKVAGELNHLFRRIIFSIIGHCMWFLKNCISFSWSEENIVIG